MLRLQPGMMSLSRDSPERQGDVRDLELGVVAGRLGEGEPAAGHERRGGGHAHEPRHAADAGTDASLESGVPGVAVPEGCERGRPGLERENGRLKRAVADLTLDKLILEEAAEGNF